MKQLNPDGSITIPSNLPRTRRGPDSRGIRLCFSELGRSCALGMGYLIFTDGSAYAYDAPSNSEIEALCDSFIRGRVFNFSVRRSRGGFVRGFTPPGDYETIYSFPPYAGSSPIACGVPFTDWSSLTWSGSRQVPPFDGSATGTGLSLVCALPSGGTALFGYGAGPINVETDANTLDVKVTNTDAVHNVDVSFTQNILGGGSLNFLGLTPGQVSTQTLTLVHGSSFFDGDASNAAHVALNFTIDLTPHL
jgi:hypothetical protein